MVRLCVPAGRELDYDTEAVDDAVAIVEQVRALPELAPDRAVCMCWGTAWEAHWLPVLPGVRKVWQVSLSLPGWQDRLKMLLRNSFIIPLL